MDERPLISHAWSTFRALAAATTRVGVTAVTFFFIGNLEAQAEGRGQPPPAIGRVPVPLPPSRPRETPAPLPEAPPLAKAEEAAPKAAEAYPALCVERLAKLGVKLEPRPAITDGLCGAQHPFRLSNLPDGIEASPAAEVGCPMAEAFARWVDEVVEPEAKTHLGLAAKTIQIGTSYQCRGQNRVSTAKLSEHAFANAVDVMGFTFDKGPPLPVKERSIDTPEGRFQAAVKSRACAYFTTVLGPGSDATHTDHLHLDLRARKGGYRVCQ
jgi:hypothetical protein